MVQTVQNGPKNGLNGSKWSKMIQKWSKNDPKIVLKLSTSDQKWLKMVQKWSKLVKKWLENGPKMVQKCFNNGSK